MSDFLQSSPLSASGQRRRSRFTFKQLAQLGQYSTVTPLRVVAHVDLDAFYAQCESIRLGLPETQPLAVQQWAGLIAVNYPARDKGVTRFLDIDEAKKLCPDIVLQHVATWREGESKWQYHPDTFRYISTHKVSLDPYRAQSRSILACIKNTLPAPPLQKVEKASVDEVFIDLSAHVHSILLERYPELKGPPPYDDPTENLPRPPTTALDWDTDALVDLDEDHTEDDDPDWDDIALCIASEIIRGVRRAIRGELKFTCSAGVAKNKMLAKLGSGHKKPNSQTIVRNRAVQQFMTGFKITKIRNLGGKFGEQVVGAFGKEQISELRDIPLEQLKLKLGDDSGSWLHSTIRGEDHSEVNSRTQIKSMLSAKSFRPVINSREQAEKWLRIFVADIFSRLVEEGVLENKRRPKTMNLHHRQGGKTWSRQIPIPQGKTISEEILFDLSKTLLQQIILEGHVWPCANLSLSVGGFEDGPSGNRGIGGFLVKGDEARSMNNTLMQEGQRETSAEPAIKKRRTEGPVIQNFFRRTESHDKPGGDGDSKSSSPAPGPVPALPHRPSNINEMSPAALREEKEVETNELLEEEEESLFIPQEEPVATPAWQPEQTDFDTWICPRCQGRMTLDEQPEHEDWHFAKDLQNADRVREQGRPTSANTNHSKVMMKESGRGRGGGFGQRKAEKGQMKLTFNKG